MVFIPFIYKISRYNLSFVIIVFLIFLSSACSKEDSNVEKDIMPTACFTIAKDTINQGDSIEVEDCSIDGTTVTYQWNGGNITLERLNSRYDISVGTNTITQKVFYKLGAITTSQDYYVRPIDDSYLWPSELTSNNTRLFAFGINPVLDRMYAIIEKNGEELYYVDVSEGLEFTLTEIDSRGANRNGFPIALCSFESDGVVYLDIPYSTTSTVQPYNYWVNPTTGESYDPIYLVSNDFNANYVAINDEKYAVGGNVKNINGVNLYVPAIKGRNSGSTITIKEFDFGEKNGMITNLIPYNNGYLASAYSFDRAYNGLSHEKPLLLELDANFDLIQTNELAIVGELNDTNIGSYIESSHMLNLPNNKILLYGQRSLRILNPDLSIAYEEVINDRFSKQEVILLDDAIILSSKDYILKYDFDGNQLARLYYGEEDVDGFVKFNDNILFMSEKLWTGVYVGMFDKDLNLIPLF